MESHDGKVREHSLLRRPKQTTNLRQWKHVLGLKDCTLDNSVEARANLEEHQRYDVDEIQHRDNIMTLLLYILYKNSFGVLMFLL